MKHIIRIIAAGIWSLAALSCAQKISGDPEDNTSVLPVISVVSHDSSFSAGGGDGQIVVRSEQPFEAVSSREWCTIKEVEADTIRFSVAASPYQESRYARITIKASTDSLNMVITQFGIIIQLDDVRSLAFTSDDAGSQYIDLVKYDGSQPSITSAEDWIAGSIEDGKLKVSVTANNSGRVRSGHLSFDSAVIDVVQFDIDKDIAGDYILKGTDPEAGGAAIAESVTLSKRSSNSLTLTFNDTANISGTVNLDLETLSLSIKNTSAFGSWTNDSKTNYIRSVFMTGEGLIYGGTYTILASLLSEDPNVFTFQASPGLGITALYMDSFTSSIRISESTHVEGGTKFSVSLPFTLERKISE